jgi:hypothetical protein
VFTTQTASSWRPDQNGGKLTPEIDTRPPTSSYDSSAEATSFASNTESPAERYENRLFRQMLVDAMRAGAHLPTVMERYFAGGDDGSVVWWMTHGAPVRQGTPFLPGSVDIADTASGQVAVSDPWGGREPQRVDAHAARGGESQIPFRVELMLDSQLVTYLHQYVRNSTRLSPENRTLVGRLLRFAVKRKLGYNPAFYFLEALREPDPLRIEHARDAARAILSLHTMDDEHFLSTGVIRPSERVQQIYQRDYGALTFADAEKSYANGFVANAGSTNLFATGIGQLRYATLLGIVAIHRQRPGTNWDDLKRKCAAFDDLLSEVGAEMPMERLVAVLYFMGLIDDFLPVQRGARPDKAIARIRAAVWDMQFLHMPAWSLIQRPDHGVVVSYPCTRDTTLGRIARAFTFELVASWRGSREPIALFGFRDRHLQRAFAIRGSQRPWPVRNRLTETQLTDMVKEREVRVLEYCSVSSK